MTCRHRSREEATACPLFRAHKAERIPPLHGPNEFRWQLSVTQDAILGSIAHMDPRPADAEHIFVPIRFVFHDNPDQFTEDLFFLRNIGLVWIDCESGMAGYTVEGRAHVQSVLTEAGSSLQQLRLNAQAQAPSTYRYTVPLVDRIQDCLAAHDDRRLRSARVLSEAVQ